MGLIEDYARLKFGLQDVVPRWSPEMQERLRAVGMDVSLGSEQVGLLRQFHRVFRIVRSVPNGRSMGEISEHLGIPFSNATRVIEQMVQHNLLQRQSSTEDRRITLIQVTSSGEQVYHVFNEAFERHLGQLLSQFTPSEQQQLLDLGHRLFEFLSTTVKGRNEIK